MEVAGTNTELGKLILIHFLRNQGTATTSLPQPRTGFDEYLDLDLDSQVQRDLDLRLEQVFQMIKSQVPHNEKDV